MLDGGAGRKALRLAIPPYVSSRLLLLLASVVFVAASPTVRQDYSSSFLVWDAPWYVQISQHGYLPGPGIPPPAVPPEADVSLDGRVVYLPLYPATIKGLEAISPFSHAAAAIVLSLLFGATAAIAFTRLGADLMSPSEVRRSVWLFCFFPGAFVFSMAYPEGLFITLGCLCLLFLIRRAWLLAGLTAALGSMTRPNGLAMFVACLVASVLAIRRDREWRSIVAPALAPIGFLSFLAYLWWRTGELGYWFHANRGFWHDEIGGWPEFRVLFGGSHPQVPQHGIERTLLLAALIVGLAILGVLVVILLRTRLPASVKSYALAYEGMAMVSQALAPRPRFILAAFPMVMALAIRLKGALFPVAMAVSGATMVGLFLFYVLTYLLDRPIIAP